MRNAPPAAEDAEPAIGGRPTHRVALGSLCLAVVLLGAAGALLAVALRGPGEPTTMDERIRSVAASLRCPVCQNLTVADSPSSLAEEMRRTIGDELRAGMTPDRIRQRFVAAYGEWILEEPPKRGVELVAWIAPGLLLALGSVTAGFAVRRWTAGGSSHDEEGSSAPPEPSLSPADRAMLDRALAEVEDDPQ